MGFAQHPRGKSLEQRKKEAGSGIKPGVILTLPDTPRTFGNVGDIFGCHKSGVSATGI